MNPIILQYKNQISEAVSLAEKEAIATQLHQYLATLPVTEQEKYANEEKKSIHRKMKVMDKLIESFEILKQDRLVSV